VRSRSCSNAWCRPGVRTRTCARARRRGRGRALEPAGELVVLGREGDLFVLGTPDDTPLAALLARCGHVPLPPYIERADEALDAERYQTVYARTPGAVAAPTAGLHFDEALLAQIAARGVAIAYITLHVGAGTFRPVRDGDLAAHVLHAEAVDVPAETCAAIASARAHGGRVVAVGTTVTRALETAAAQRGDLQPFQGETRLFIRDGYAFRVVDALLTNFHLPRSTLLMLVCAFGGHAGVMAAYRHAVAAGYRFFSYGDAMWVERGGGG
jgi:S-adenosylmethionine:tRNA ribosyltransferase-isomerase